MNKYLVCFSFVALCFCLTDAATTNDVQRLIHQASQQVRTQENVVIKTATRDAMIRATTPQEKACVTSKIGPASRDLKMALKYELIASKAEYKNLTPQQLEQTDLNGLFAELNRRFTSVATAAVNGWVNQINQCF